MTDVTVLKSLAGAQSSGVRLLKNHELTLSLSPCYATDVELGVQKVLASKMLEYEPRYQRSIPSLIIILISQFEWSPAQQRGLQKCPTGIQG